MDTELIAVCAVQIFVLALVVVAIVVYLLRHLMCRSRLDVTGRSLVITGCDSALGFDLARRYDQLGFRVYAGFENTAGEAAVRLQADASSRLRIIPLDVTCTASLAAAAKLVKEQLPPSEKGLWALINAATYCVCGELEWQTQKHCEQQFRVNYVGVVDSIRIFLPLLKSGGGRIINVGSLAGGHNDPEPGLSIYSGTKHAVEGLSEALRFELARVGVDVSLVQPDSSFLDKCLFDQHHKKMNEMWNEMTPELRLANQDIFIAYHDRVAKSKSEELEMDDMETATRAQAPTIPVYLCRCFDDALMAKSPSDVYVAVPGCATRFRISLLFCIPSGLRQYIVQRKYKHNIANILKV
ncbi:hypothetical protein GHT06_013346 [Daphnia sinensis]|uniref:Uncharacterized protein n=1 Tax=Daphnia sinensis TaxID=1820382 RepID=A0AAD5PWF9_9CRUS|nr:hypothetical protein GHT06_013346 [Daphnia sinensis]